MRSPYDYKFSQNAKRMKASEIRELLKLTQRPEVISFAGGLPNPDAFPIAELRQVIEHVLDEHARDALQYCATEGHNKLRDAIARGMGAVHNTPQSIQNVLITHGSQQALSLLSHVLLDPGDTVVTGAPAYLGATLGFAAFRAQIESVPLDSQGVNPELLAEKLESLAQHKRLPKFVYLVPTFQNPSGVTIPLERRERIYELLCRHDLLLIEDDPYGFLRYEGENVPLIKSLDEEERVIYLSSFSKILAPGFRIAWMVAPQSIVNRACLAKQAQDLCSNTFAQYCIFEAMYHDVLFPHIELIKDMYRRKRDTMQDQPQEQAAFRVVPLHLRREVLLHGRQHRCPCSAERVEHRVPDKGEHPDESVSQFIWKRCGMIPCRGARNLPELLEPHVELLLVNHGKTALFSRRFPVAARLALHQDELDIVLDDRVRFIGFPEELAAVAYLVVGVRNLVPNDRVEVVKAEMPASHGNICMQRDNEMTPVSAARQAHVADNTDQPSPGNQKPVTLLPDRRKLIQELLIVCDMAHLAWLFAVSLEGPIWWRRHDKMEALITQKREVSSVSMNQLMGGFLHYIPCVPRVESNSLTAV